VPVPRFEIIKGRVPACFSGLLRKVKGVVHAFPCRTGTPEESIDILAGRMKSVFGLENIATVDQVHGTAVVVCDEDVDDPEKLGSKRADAIIAARRFVAVGVRTADCLPILVADKDARVAAAVHAGWKGLASGVVSSAVEAIEEKYNVAPGDLLVAVGPHIGACCYEVGPEVAEVYMKKFGDGVLRPGKGDRSYLDLGEAAKKTLIKHGLKIENVEILNLCTSCDEEHFYSYRRDGKNAGRQLSFIMLR